jgi:4-carboxymuconolactone decarboxylase
MSRLPPLDRESLDDDARRQWDILASWREPHNGVFGGPYDAWLRSPELSHRAQGFGGFLWERTSLERGLLEYLIALTSRHWQCNIEWDFHIDRARHYGIGEEALARLERGQPPESDTKLDTAFRLATALLAGKALSESLYERGLENFGERGLAEIAALTGYYTMVAFTLRTFDIEPRTGVPRAFPRPEEAHA